MCILLFGLFWSTVLLSLTPFMTSSALFRKMSDRYVLMGRVFLRAENIYTGVPSLHHRRLTELPIKSSACRAGFEAFTLHGAGYGILALSKTYPALPLPHDSAYCVCGPQNNANSANGSGAPPPPPSTPVLYALGFFLVV